MMAVWIDRCLLRLRWKACAAWSLFWRQGKTTRAALRAREIAEATTAAAEVIEALVGLYGAFLRPGNPQRRAVA